MLLLPTDIHASRSPLIPQELPGILDIPDDLPSQPMIFLKSPHTIQRGGSDWSELPIPTWSVDVHHEVELAVQLGEDLKPCHAAVSIDLTARDMQVCWAQHWPDNRKNEAMCTTCFS